MPKRKKPQRGPRSARQRAIAAGVRRGLTPGQAYYQYRLSSKLHTGRTVQEARGHATSGESKPKKQRSKVAKNLGFNIDGPIQERKRVVRSDRVTVQQVFVFSHLTDEQVRPAFYDVVLPYAIRYAKRHARLIPTFRFVYLGRVGTLEISGERNEMKVWSDMWSNMRSSDRDATGYLVRRFEELYTTRDVKLLSVYLSNVGEHRRDG